MVTITIAGTRTGTGKTTVAVNLAAELAALGARVAIQDLDARGHTTTALGQDPVRDPWSAEPLDVQLDPAATWSLRLGPAGRPLAGARGHDVRVLLGRWRGEVEVLIIDTPPGAAAVTTAAVEAADLLLTPLNAASDPGDIRNASQIRWMMGGASTGFRAVLTGVPAPRSRSLRQLIAESYPTVLLDTEIPPVANVPAPRVFRLADPQGAAAQAYRRLTHEILSALRAENAVSSAA